MKQKICMLLAIMIITSGFGQQTEPQKQLTKQDFLDKSKNQNKAAKVMAWGGSGIVLISLISFPKDYVFISGTGNNTDSEESMATFSTVLFFVGSVSILGSIPLFIASGKNKKKANSITLNLKTEKLKTLQQNGLANINYPALSLKIKM